MKFGKPTIALALALVAMLGALAWARVWTGILAVLGIALLLELTLRHLAREQRAAEEALRLRATLDSAEDGILVVDGNGGTLDFNRTFLAMWGLPEGAMAGAGGRELMLRQLRNPEALETGAPGPEVLQFWDGKVFERYARPNLVRGEERGRVLSFRDVTARARADLFVQRLSQAVEQCPVSIIITDTSGAMEFVNPQFTQLTGYALDEALGQNPRILNSRLMDPKVFEEMWSTIAAGRVWAGDLQNRKKNGELFWERATISPMTDPDGVITHFLGLKEDITAHKRLEQQLRRSQKLEAVGLLAGGVAHDFNNVLQVINGYGTLMQISQAPDDPHRGSLGEILKAAERAAQLTHSLLAFSRKQVMNTKILDLNVIVGSVEKLLRRIIGEDVTLQVAFHEQALLVLADMSQMEQVLLNLATNARDAMPKGGSLSLTTDRVYLGEEFHSEHGFGHPGDYALLQVRDSGEGMDEVTQKRIFDPFYTTKEMGRGTGLGLAMVYGIVKQHGGYILVESARGEGSIFRIYLPVVTRPPSPPEEDPVLAPGVRGSETILVAEDEPGVRGMVEMVLGNFGYKVLLARDGQEAVDLYRSHAGSIGMVLMDIIMPRKSGKQAWEEIRLEHPEARVLFTSGYTADFIRGRGEMENGMELIMKPVQPMALLRKIRDVLDRPAASPA